MILALSIAGMALYIPNLGNDRADEQDRYEHQSIEGCFRIEGLILRSRKHSSPKNIKKAHIANQHSSIATPAK